MPGLTKQAPRRARLALAAAVAAFTVLSAFCATASAAYPGHNGRIAFVRNHSIYTISDSGTQLQRLTHHGDCSSPRWSPNGTRIAFVCGGDLWTMHANGSHKTRLTNAAPRFSDSRPSWAPDGDYLAFVKTARHRDYGYLTRYDLATRAQVTFSTPYHSENPTARQVKVTALPDAVAWGWALTGGSYGSFILFDGAGSFCQAARSCLDALGFPAQNRYRNGFPSGEDSALLPHRITDPDWFPNAPQFDTDALTSWASCPSGHCTPSGLRLKITSSLSHPGAYQAVYSPDGTEIAYVRDGNGGPTIYAQPTSPVVIDRPAKLTAGSEPDWQPLSAPVG